MCGAGRWLRCPRGMISSWPFLCPPMQYEAWNLHGMTHQLSMRTMIRQNQKNLDATAWYPIIQYLHVTHTHTHTHTYTHHHRPFKYMLDACVSMCVSMCARVCV